LGVQIEDEMEGPCRCMGEMRNAYKIMVGKPERDHLEDLDVDGSY
jgi:hypothetical protein